MADLAPGKQMNRIVRAGPCLAFALWLCGCSTLSGDFHQKLQIDALDAQNRPVEGMRCQVGSGDSAKTISTPASDVRVRRSALPLNIECRQDSQVATAVVKPRRERMEEALLPFGSVGVFVDHLSGSLYGYPTTLHLRVGQHVVLEHGGEAQVATSEPIPPSPAAVNRAAQPIQVAALQPTLVSTATVKASPAAAAQKIRSFPVAKADHATAKPIKTAPIAAAVAKPSATTPQKLALTTTPAGSAAVHSAPVNW
jgi:hypothetical protein